MSRFWQILVLVIAAFSTGMVSEAESPSEDELKARFSQRHQALQRLKDAQKVGETTKGLIDVVRDEYRKDTVTVDDEDNMTVAAFVQRENADRRKLYALIAERTSEPVAEVARQAAIRNFRRASPDHYLKLRTGEWVLKKQLPKSK